MNSKDQNKIRVLTYKDGDLYYASALELNITSSGQDKYIAMYNLDEAIKGYIEVANNENMDEMVLNQSPDPELEDMWSRFASNSLVKSPLHVVSTSIFETSSFI